MPVAFIPHAGLTGGVARGRRSSARGRGWARVEDWRCGVPTGPDGVTSTSVRRNPWTYVESEDLAELLQRDQGAVQTAERGVERVPCDSVTGVRAVRRRTVGDSWQVSVNLTSTAMWCGSLSLVDPALAGSDEEHSLREPAAYDAPTPLGDVHMLAPPVHFSRTPAAWPDPILVPRGSSRPEWRS
jgi:hypothetical protein